MKANCGTCAYYKRTPVFGPGMGICCRHAPVVVQSGDHAGDTASPRINEFDRCGDYEIPGNVAIFKAAAGL